MDQTASPKGFVAEFVANVSHPDAMLCRCQGGGWINSPFDTWEKCPVHFSGQPDPELFDYPEEVETGPLFEVTIHPSTGIGDLYTRFVSLSKLGEFTVEVLRIDPGTKVTINP